MSQEAAKLDRFMLHLREYVLDAPEGSQGPSCARPGCSAHVTYRCGHRSVRRYCSYRCQQADTLKRHLEIPLISIPSPQPPGSSREFQSHSTPADKAKMESNRAAVLALMLDGRERSLRMIRAECGFDPETEISARLRELRRPEYGGYEVKCWRFPDGVYRYQLAVPE